MRQYYTLCLAVANKVAMTYGDLTFHNVLDALKTETNSDFVHDITVERFAAMVVQAHKAYTSPIVYP